MCCNVPAYAPSPIKQKLFRSWPTNASDLGGSRSCDSIPWISNGSDKSRDMSAARPIHKTSESVSLSPLISQGSLLGLVMTHGQRV